MRTTINLEADVLRAAKQLAAARAISLGAAVSELARRGLHAAGGASSPPTDFPQFEVREDAGRFSLDDIRREDDEW